MLGLNGTESIDQVRRAYRRLARRLHPDLVGGDAAQFKEITAAYNQLVQALKDAAGSRASTPNSPRRSRRKASDSRRTSHDGTRRNSTAQDAWTPWSPSEPSDTNQKKRANDAEDADWSTFEKVYREQMKNRVRRTSRDVPHSARRTRSSEAVDTDHSGSKGEDAVAPQAPREEHDGQRGERITEPRQPRTQRNSQTPRPERAPDEDFSAAWAAWCESARRFEARHGWREVKTDLPTGLTKSRITASETESETGFRRWFKRGLEKLKTGKDRRGRTRQTSSFARECRAHGGRQRLAITREALCPVCQGAAPADWACLGKGRVALREEVSETRRVSTLVLNSVFKGRGRRGCQVIVVEIYISP